MPLCPQITNTPITVSLTGSFTVTSVLPTGKNKTYYQTTAPTGGMLEGDLWVDTDDGNKMYRYTSGSWVSVQDGAIATANANASTAITTANAAAATAATAQSTANTALANAATAYTTAVNSLQPSAYAIQNPITKQLTSIDATGLTVYSGASPTSGARVVLNSLGLAGFDSSGSGIASFSISASTGAAVFRGNITTGATITGGTLNIAGKTIIDGAGLLTGTDVTLTGTINALSGYFGSPTNGWSISSTGLVGVGTGTIVTSTGSNAIVLSSTDNAIGIKSGGSYAGWIGSIGSGAILIHYGTSPSSVAYPRAAMSSTAGTLSGTASSGYSANTDGTNTIAGITRFFNSVQVDQSITAGSSGSLFEFLSSTGNVRVAQTYSTVASSRAMYVSTAGLYGTLSSTEKRKKDIEPYQIDEDALLALDVQTFRFKDELDDDQERQYGFIAEDADALGLFELVGYDKEGLPDYFAYDKLGIFLIPIVRKLKAEIDQLKGA